MLCEVIVDNHTFCMRVFILEKCECLCEWVSECCFYFIVSLFYHLFLLNALFLIGIRAIFTQFARLHSHEHNFENWQQPINQLLLILFLHHFVLCVQCNLWTACCQYPQKLKRKSQKNYFNINPSTSLLYGFPIDLKLPCYFVVQHWSGGHCELIVFVWMFWVLKWTILFSIVC